MDWIKLIIISLIILMFFAFIYVALPLWAKLLFFILNSFVPDPIPVVDEVFMFVSMINDIAKIFKVIAIAQWIRIHRKLLLQMGIAIILFIVIVLLLHR